MEDGAGAGPGPALELGFDVPGDGGAVVAGEEGIGYGCVFVFGVDEEAVHVEEAGADGGEGRTGRHGCVDVVLCGEKDLIGAASEWRVVDVERM